jgi:RNA polymerase sigma factor (sigma-70 family)
MEAQYVRAPPAVATNNAAERIASLFEMHYDRLYRLARRLTSNSDDALDLIQETFLRATRFPKSIPIGTTEEEAWLVRVLINIRRDQWRKASVRERYDRSQTKGSKLVIGSPNPEASLIARAAVWKALEILPPRRRAIVVMHELEGLAIPAVASLLGISAITVRWHLSRGRFDLIRALKDYMGDAK